MVMLDDGDSLVDTHLDPHCPGSRKYRDSPISDPRKFMESRLLRSVRR
jgi:hypothetical protein